MQRLVIIVQGSVAVQNMALLQKQRYRTMIKKSRRTKIEGTDQMGVQNKESRIIWLTEQFIDNCSVVVL